MELILQSRGADLVTLNRLADRAQPQQRFVTESGALYCAGVSQSANWQELRTELEHLAFQAQVDVAWLDQPLKWGDFKLLAMDMDSTLITIECIDEIADMQGLKPQVAAITESAMRGEIEFTESLTRRVGLLKGLPEAALQQVYDQRLQLSPGAANLLHTVRSHQLATLLVSGGFTFFTERIKAALKFDFTHANQLEIIDGKLTGRVVGSVVDAEAKRAKVDEVCQQLGCSSKRAIVIGDGANDLAMMAGAGLSVAYRAKPRVRQQARIALNFVGLDGVLNLFQGD